jgi:hypothetical protein
MYFGEKNMYYIKSASFKKSTGMEEAILLTTLGYNVVILTAWNSPEMLQQDYKIISRS